MMALIARLEEEKAEATKGSKGEKSGAEGAKGGKGSNPSHAAKGGHKTDKTGARAHGVLLAPAPWLLLDAA
jgi:hypothetical protein